MKISNEMAHFFCGFFLYLAKFDLMYLGERQNFNLATTSSMNQVILTSLKIFLLNASIINYHYLVTALLFVIL